MAKGATAHGTANFPAKLPLARLWIVVGQSALHGRPVDRHRLHFGRCAAFTCDVFSPFRAIMSWPRVSVVRSATLRLSTSE